MLEIRQEFANASLAKFNAALNWSVEGTVRGSLIYHGAKTGRWTGAGVQFQNVPASPLIDSDGKMNRLCELIKTRSPEMVEHGHEELGDLLKCLKAALRGMIVAPEGYELVALDYSQIEPRVLAWLGGDEEALAVFNSGEDIYKHAATGIFDCAIDEVGKEERKMGKLAVLSLGYATGWEKFQDRADAAGIELTEKRSKEIVYGWRDSNKHTTKLWESLEKMVMATIKTGQPFTLRGGRVTTRLAGEFLHIELPSGRALHYLRPSVAWHSRIDKKGVKRTNESAFFMGSDTGKGVKWGKISTYGGKIVENVIQAIARDLLVYSMFEFEKEGAELMFTVHDELIFQQKIGSRSMDECLAIMNRKPDWAEGIPLASSGFIAHRYRK